MKNIIILLLLAFTSSVFGQFVKQQVICDFATLTSDDTTVWVKAKSLNGRYLEIDFTELNANTDTLDIGMSNVDSTYRSVGDVVSGLTYPVLMDGAGSSDYKTISEGTASWGVGILSSVFAAKYAVIKVSKGTAGSNSGKVYLTY